MANSTLTAIRTKVRRLTRNPSPAQISDDEINEYVNTFVLYDFPEHLRLFSLRKVFTFYTEPYTEEYDSANPAPELNDFENKYITVHEPVFIDGTRVQLYQDRDRFYSVYPRTNSRVTIATGDGITTDFSGTLDNAPIVKNNVLFSAIDSDNQSLELNDNQGGAGTVEDLTGTGTGQIDYVTGDYSLEFFDPPAANTDVVSHTIPYVPSIPQSLLFFDNKFYVRPIPDQAYRVDMEVYQRPTELLAGNSPELEQWWQYIAIASALKILYDRTDFETAAQLQPLLKQQELLVLRKTIVQQTNDRVYTIYADNIDTQGSFWWNGR
jgi:hypothetical protein